MVIISGVPIFRIFTVFMVNGYTFRGSNSFIFICAPHINWGHFIKERICSLWSKFFPLRVDLFLGRLCPLGRHTGSHENCLPLKPWRKKIVVNPYSFRHATLFFDNFCSAALKMLEYYPRNISKINTSKKMIVGFILIKHPKMY